MKIDYWDSEADEQRQRDMTPEEVAQFEAQANQPAPARPRHITNLAFRSRFTSAEKVAIELAAMDNPAAEMAERLQAAAVRAALADVAAAKFIDLDRSDARAGVEALETAGVIAAGRAVEILDAPVLDVERP